jgi:hypothetical protein
MKFFYHYNFPLARSLKYYETPEFLLVFHLFILSQDIDFVAVDAKATVDHDLMISLY